MRELKRVLPVIVMLGAIAAPAGIGAQERTPSRQKEKERDDRCECFRVQAAPRAMALAGVLGNRARLGVMIDNDADMDSVGARIEEVMDDSPADAAGLQDGDIITHVAGKRVQGDGDESAGGRLIELMSDVEPGDTVKIDYRRGREVRTATVVTKDSGDSMFRMFDFDGTAPHVYQRTPGSFRFEVGPRGEARTHVSILNRHFGAGMRLEAMNAGLATYFGTGEGVLVLEVDEDSELGLEPGDVILRIGSRSVDDPGRVHELLETYRDDEEITIEVMRNKQRVTVTGER